MAENAPPVNLSVSRCQLPNRKYEDCNPDNLVEKTWRLVGQEWWWAPPYFWKPSSPSRTAWSSVPNHMAPIPLRASLLLRLFSSPFSRWRLQFGPHLDQCQHPVLHLDLQFWAPPGPMPASSASSTPSTPGPMPAPSGVMAKHQTGAYPAKSVSVLPFKRQNVSPSERWELDRKNPKRETTTWPPWPWETEWRVKKGAGSHCCVCVFF